MGGFILFGDLVSKNIGVGESDRSAPKIHQNTDSLKFPIGQNNLDRKFGLNLTSHNMLCHDSRLNETHRSVKGVPEGFFFQRGLLWAILPTSAPVRRSFSFFIALAATYLIRTTTLTATTTLIATTTLRLTTFELTLNGPMGVIAWRTRLTRPEGAICDTPINMVVHIRLFTLFPMLGTRNPRARCRFRPGVDRFLRRGLG